jgi:polar amino acid transport system substrate-binding protein
MLVEVTRLILDTARVPFQLVTLPARRIPETLKRGGNTCSIGWFRTREREADFLFADEPIYQDKPFCVVMRSDQGAHLAPAPGIREILQSRLELGLIEGFAYGDWLEENLEACRPRCQRVAIGEDSEVMYQMLLGNRFDYMFAGSEEGSYMLRTHPEFASHLALVPVADAPRGNKRYLMFSRGVDPGLLARINAVIPAVRHSKAYRQILQAAEK